MAKTQNFFSPFIKATQVKGTGNKFSSAKPYFSVVTSIYPYAGALLLLLLPAAFVTFYTEGTSLFFSAKEILLSVFLFLIPIVFFYKNLRLYFYALLPLIILSPFFILAVVLFDLKPRFELIVLVMQTNFGEMMEAIRGYLTVFLPLTLVYSLLYLYFVGKMKYRSLPFKAALFISSLAVLFSFGRISFEKELHKQPLAEIESADLLSVRYYPVSLVGGAMEAYSTFAAGKMNVPENFSFQAFAKDSLPQRKVFVFIIGESSRFDRWQINGYHKPTSPRLLQQKHLISFPQVVSGSNQTRMAVPQMITRATPDSIDLLFEEKSIMAAFSELGYKTAWLSNQTDQEVFWSGAINWHAKTADYSVFSPSQSPNFEFDAPYDERLLPMLDSLLVSSNENLFIILHTMGNHWDYSKRYPASFDIFKPSGKTVSITKPDESNRHAVSNSYDNSILYADFFIDSVIKTLGKHQLISTVTYLSDHGEDLYDADHARIDFHLNESPITLHVPMFVWTSDLFRQHYPEKQKALLANRDRKIGTENTFYTLLDLANIGIAKNDSTKSLASFAFKDSKQMYLGNKEPKPFYYSNLLKQSVAGNP